MLAATSRAEMSLARACTTHAHAPDACGYARQTSGVDHARIVGVVTQRLNARSPVRPSASMHFEVQMV
jgi:hypothetical protein